MSVVSPAPRARRRRAAAGAACIVGALMAAYASSEVGHEWARAASLGTLTVLPATGDTNTPDVAFSTSAACPANANGFRIAMTGAGLPENINAVGFADIPLPGAAFDHFPMGATFAQQLPQQGATLPLSGVATLTLTCYADGADVGDFAATVAFTPTTGTDSSYTAGAAPTGGPSPSPSTSPAHSGSPSASPSPSVSPSVSPSPSTSPSPNPSTSPSPSASPCATPTPTASPAASPSPAPSATPCASPSPSPTSSPSPSGTVTPAATVSPTNGIGGGGLPATGSGASRPLLILAALLLVCGAFLLALSAPAVAEERQQ